MGKRLGFVGMGTMGAPMAGHLLAAGHDVTVWNRTRVKALPLAERGATIADSLADLVGLDAVLLCVGGTDDVRAVVDALPPTGLVIDHSTIAPDGARSIADAVAARGGRFVDAPVTGGSMGAANGTLTIFLGGEEADCDAAKEIVAPYAKRAERVGPSGAGQTMKAANQIAVGGALLALAESLAFAKRAGLDLGQARAMIGAGSGGSWAFENYGPKMLRDDVTPGFAVRHQRKDFRYVRAAAADIGAALPGTEAVDALLAEAEARGWDDLTTGVIFRLLVEEA